MQAACLCVPMHRLLMVFMSLGSLFNTPDQA